MTSIAAHLNVRVSLVVTFFGFYVAVRPRRRDDLLGTGAQDGHLDFHTAPEL